MPNSKLQVLDADTLQIKKVENVNMWQDYEYGRPGVYSGYRNDFHSWVADEWTIIEVGTSLQKLKDAANGVLQLTSGGTEDDGNNCQLGGSADSETVGESFKPAAGRTIYFEAIVASDDVTQHDFFIGLSVQDTAIIASNAADIIGFRTDDGDALLDFFTSASSIVTTDAGIATLVNDTQVRLGFKIIGTQLVEYWINDVKKGSFTTNIPSTEMKLSMAQLTGEGNAATLEVDWVICEQSRNLSI